MQAHDVVVDVFGVEKKRAGLFVVEVRQPADDDDAILAPGLDARSDSSRLADENCRDEFPQPRREFTHLASFPTPSKASVYEQLGTSLRAPFATATGFLRAAGTSSLYLAVGEAESAGR